MSPTLELNEKCKLLEAQGRDIIKWGFGQSPFPLHPLMVEALIKKCQHNQYLPVEGLYELRSAICKYYKKFNVDRSPENVIVSPGTKELLFILAQVFHGQFIIPTPGWVSYFNQLELLGKSWISIETKYENKWKIQPQELEEAIMNPNNNAEKILILNSPGNPTGQIYTRAELESIVAVCRKHKILVLADEIYNELVYGDGADTGRSIASLYPEGTIISNGVSKSYDAGGWRFGYFIFPSELNHILSRFKQFASEIYSCVSAPVQYAMIDIYRPDNLQKLSEYIDSKNKVLKLLAEKISERLISMGVKTYIPEGGFYMFLDFSRWRRDGVQSKDFFLKMLNDTNIALLTGECFGRNGLEEWSARLAFVDLRGFDASEGRLPQRLEKALDKLETWLNSLDLTDQN